MNLLKLAVDTALEAGNEILKIYYTKNFNVKYKNDNSPLTSADIKSNEIITKNLKVSKIPILSEEGATIPYEIRKKWKKLWIIDPIDGTKEFINKNGEFTVNIALINNSKPILGVIYAPVLKELYFSSKITGSRKVVISNLQNDYNNILKKSSKLPFDYQKDNYTIVASRSHLNDETITYIKKQKKIFRNVNLISKGSSLKLCLVAEGSADCYPRFAPTMEWDTAAGHSICSEAGIKLIDMYTNLEMKYNRENLKNNNFVAKR